MKTNKTYISTIIVFVLFFALKLSAGNATKQTIYAYGIAASFNDSTVYMTNIQRMDSIWIENKTGFLINRGTYSNQLRDYLTSINEPNRTCIIFFSLKNKDIEKKYATMRKKYSTKNNFMIKDITDTQFKFKSVPYYDNNVEKPKTKAVKQAAQNTNGTHQRHGGGGRNKFMQ